MDAHANLDLLLDTDSLRFACSCKMELLSYSSLCLFNIGKYIIEEEKAGRLLYIRNYYFGPAHPREPRRNPFRYTAFITE